MDQTTERLYFRVQAAEVGFFRRIEGVSRADVVRCTEICKSLNMESQLFCIEVSAL